MFKRVSKLFEKVAKAEEAGVPIAEDAPVEYHLDEDSSSDDSSDEDSDDDSSDDEDEEAAADKSGKGKAKAAAGAEDSDEDSDDDESDAESEGGGADDEVPLTITQSLESQIYVSPRAEKKKDYLVRSCVVCPTVKLKSDKMVEVHLESGSHKRRFKRYKTFVEKKLTEVERTAAPKDGGADPRGVAAEVAAAQKKDQARAEAQRKVKLAEERAARKIRKSAKAEKKKAAKAEKADKVEGAPNRKARRAAQIAAASAGDASAPAATEAGAVVLASSANPTAEGAPAAGTQVSKKRKLDAVSGGAQLEKRAKRRGPQEEAKAERRVAKKLAKANKRAGLTADGKPREKVKKQTKYTAQKAKRTEQRQRDGGWGKVAQSH